MHTCSEIGKLVDDSGKIDLKIQQTAHNGLPWQNAHSDQFQLFRMLDKQKCL